MDQGQTINISTSTILRTLLILLGFFFLYLIKDIVVIILISVIIAAAINGPASWLQKRKVPRLLGVIFIYLLFSLIIALVFSLVLPPLSSQIKQLANYFPGLLEKFGLSVQERWGEYNLSGNFQQLLNNLGNRLSQATSSIFAAIIGLFGGIFSATVILVISFYLAVQERGVKKFVISLSPRDHQHYLSGLIDRIQSKIGGWLRGQLMLMLTIGVLTYIGLYFLDVKYALTLALLAGFLEIIPYVGPIISAVPAVALAFIQSPMLALMVIILYLVVQQLENYVIAPQIMKKTVGLNPIVNIIVMLIGAKLAGVLGIILAVPVAASIGEFLKDLREE